MRTMDVTAGARARGAGRRGSAIVFALVALTGLMMIGAAFHHMTARQAREVTARIEQRRAFHLADAALAEAMVAVRAEAPGAGAIASQANPAYLGDGVLWVTSTDLGGNQRLLVATAMAGSGRASVQATVRLDPNPLFDTVLNSRETLTLNADVMLDSYDSELGTYASQATNTFGIHTYANKDGDVSSNQGIVLNSDATVFGDATPGPGYGVSFASGSYVSGSTAPAPKAFSFPPIDVPSVPSVGPFSAAPNSSTTLPSGIYGFDDFTLNKSASLTVTGPATIVVDNFTGGKDARLHVDATAGPVTFFVQGNYSHMANFEVQPVTGSPIAVAFMVEGSGGVTFPGGTKVRGAYYVPNANVLFGANNEAWGSFGANRIDMASTMKFHYDESLAKHWKADSGGQNDPLHLLAWAPSTFAPAALLRDRSDPFQVLGVNKTALASPASSW